MCALRLGNLDCEVIKSAAAAVDQHAVPTSDVGDVHDAVPHREPHQW
jgi:hypothetical protein